MIYNVVSFNCTAKSFRFFSITGYYTVSRIVSWALQLVLVGYLFYLWCVFGGFLGDSVVKNPPANAGDARDLGSIPGSERFPGEENDNHSSILAWKTP